MSKTTKTLLMYTGAVALLLGIITFVTPYIEDAFNRMVRTQAWWAHNGAVAWFWGPADPSMGLYAPFWMFSVGLIIVGILLSSISLGVKG